MPRTVSSAQLAALQRHPHRVHNICILAHVDHGKTTLADALVASNGVISARLAGRLRYLDSRPDEQRRGITMKSSAIALQHVDAAGQQHLVNLIDSPGHVDFSSEVSTAVRLCDGAIVLVDVVEGVCAQTKAVLRQAWTENIRPVLVLNKIDRLVLEMGLTPLSAHLRLSQVLEQVNAVMAELFTSEFMERGSGQRPAADPATDPAADPATDSATDPASGEVTRDMADWATGLEDVDDSSVYFSPDAGNVLFASAYDGWGFGIKHFSKIYSDRLGIREEVLLKTLWGDFYLNAKTKRIMRGAQEKAKTPLFVQFILQNVWAVYNAIAVRKDKEAIEKIIASLKLVVSPRDLRSTDPRVQLQAVFSQWLPLAPAVLDMVLVHLPAAASLSPERAQRLLAGVGRRFDELPAETRALLPLFTNCSGADDVPVIVFVSKMVAVDRAELPENRARPLTAEEMQRRREEARRRHEARLLAPPDNDPTAGVPLSDGQVAALKDAATAGEPAAADHSDVFVAFARVFSGTLRAGRRLLVLGPKHEPAAALRQLAAAGQLATAGTVADLPAGQHITECCVGPLYLLMGRALEELAEAPAGCLVGIGGLTDHVLKSATLASTVACPAFAELSSAVVPIVRVAVEPARPAELPRLVAGLRLLNQADACVRVTVQESGEHVLVTAGEVHLQRCLDDLRERFAGIDVVASAPIVPFRETVVVPPQLDMVNEAIDEGAAIRGASGDGAVEVVTPGRRAVVTVRAVPLPDDVTRLLDESAALLARLHCGGWTHRRAEPQREDATADGGRDSQPDAVAADRLTDAAGRAPSPDDVLEKSDTEPSEKLRLELHEQGADGGDDGPAGAVSWGRARRCRDELRRRLRAAGSDRLAELVDRVWSFGPRRCGPNLLFNAVAGYRRASVWEPPPASAGCESPLAAFDDSVVHGFQLATAAGPLCEEPMRGVAFVVEALATREPGGDADAEAAPRGPLSGQIVSAVLAACRRAFQAQPQRLMAAMYRCQVQVTAAALGRMYSVIGRRGGRIVHGDRNEGSHCFSVTAYVPVVESFSLAQELQKETSGLAVPQLVFSHWETLDTDPFWVPTTEEEYLMFGQKADTENSARRHMNAVRRRKGLAVDEKIVEFGEKQRTLARKK